MTRRERQLLEWIRENPCISQQELADKAGITRSSAAVHISNLMRKGYIAGRGYLLREAPYIAVVGGVNMDIGAVSDAPLVARDSNPGRVTTSLGGVGRNIAHNLCLLGEQVSMITVLGQDSFAQSVRENAADIGLDLSHSATIPGGRTGTYLFIDGCDGDMALAVNDMAIYEHITPEFLRQRLDYINHADLVVVETNLPEASIQWLCSHCTAPVLADPVSTIKAPKLLPVLDKLTALKPNRMEAELLSGVTIRDETDVQKAAKGPAEQGRSAGVYLPGERWPVRRGPGGAARAPALPEGAGGERHRRRGCHGGGAGRVHRPRETPGGVRAEGRWGRRAGLYGGGDHPPRHELGECGLYFGQYRHEQESVNRIA